MEWTVECTGDDIVIVALKGPGDFYKRGKLQEFFDSLIVGRHHKVVVDATKLMPPRYDGFTALMAGCHQYLNSHLGRIHLVTRPEEMRAAKVLNIGSGFASREEALAEFRDEGLADVS